MNQPGPMTLQRTLHGICCIIRIAVLKHQGTSTSTYLEDDVADVEYTQHCVVVVTSQAQITLQASQPCIADVGTIDEAEEIEQGHCWNDHKVNLRAKPPFCCLVEFDQCIAVPSHHSQLYESG